MGGIGFGGELVVIIVFIYIIIRLILAVVRKRKVDWYKQSIRSLFVIYMAMLISVTLFPMYIGDNGRRVIPVIYNLNPLKFYGLIPFSREFMINIGGNIVMMIPYTILLAFNFRYMRNWKNAVGTAFLTSLTIELLQLVQEITMLNIDRRGDVDDIICNVAGAGIGYLLYRYFFSAIPLFKRFIIRRKVSQLAMNSGHT